MKSNNSSYNLGKLVKDGKRVLAATIVGGLLAACESTPRSVEPQSQWNYRLGENVTHVGKRDPQAYEKALGHVFVKAFGVEKYVQEVRQEIDRVADGVANETTSTDKDDEMMTYVNGTVLPANLNIIGIRKSPLALIQYTTQEEARKCWSNPDPNFTGGAFLYDAVDKVLYEIPHGRGNVHCAVYEGAVNRLEQLVGQTASSQKSVVNRDEWHMFEGTDIIFAEIKYHEFGNDRLVPHDKHSNFWFPSATSERVIKQMDAKEVAKIQADFGSRLTHFQQGPYWMQVEDPIFSGVVYALTMEPIAAAANLVANLLINNSYQVNRLTANVQLHDPTPLGRRSIDSILSSQLGRNKIVVPTKYGIAVANVGKPKFFAEVTEDKITVARDKWGALYMKGMAAALTILGNQLREDVETEVRTETRTITQDGNGLGRMGGIHPVPK
jgi:hypothetical protein